MSSQHQDILIFDPFCRNLQLPGPKETMTNNAGKKQAVVLIHGIGEQKPMDTLRGFVDAVWTRHSAIHHKYAGSGLWSKPDKVSGGFELRRLTTPQNAAAIRTDFFEFYWAHLMEGTSYGHVFAWARSLLLRRPSTVPKQLMPLSSLARTRKI